MALLLRKLTTEWMKKPVGLAVWEAQLMGYWAISQMEYKHPRNHSSRDSWDHGSVSEILVVKVISHKRCQARLWLQRIKATITWTESLPTIKLWLAWVLSTWIKLLHSGISIISEIKISKTAPKMKMVLECIQIAEAIQ